MLLKSIKLRNIRSYTNQEVNFDRGSTLLSGDIGSGKSSILLAIEFALFGIRGKKLSGESLLRKGKKEGSVELKFRVGEKDIIVKRKIKDTKNGVRQTSGYIIKEGRKKEGTATELKADIINYIGYPKELISKTKNLVYRYTVYTPQEDMKKILSEDAELRLDTLRKVFGIDKYKKIAENCVLVTRNIKEKKKELTGKTEDLEEKKKEKKKIETEFEELNKKKDKLIPKIEQAQKKVKEKKEDIEYIEKKVKEFNSLKQKLDVKKVEEKNKHENFKNIKKDISELDEKIEKLRKEIPDKKRIDKKEIKDKIRKKKEEIEKIEKKLNKVSKIISEFEIKRKQADKNKSKILSMDECPTCKQNVREEHKKSITERENEKIEKYEKNIEKHDQEKKKLKQKLDNLKEEDEKLSKKLSNISIIELKRKELKEKEEKKKSLLEKKKEIKKSIGEIYSQKKDLEKNISELKNVEEKYNKLKEKVDRSMEKEKKLEIEKTGIEKEIEGVNKRKDMIDKEIKIKQEAKKKLNYLGELVQWLEEGFTKLTATMEKQVMLSVYNEFNELFQSWFDTLMEDETINVRLNDSFSPIIEQNGYEISFENLSGGERTSAALAYRLALNKVVNDLMKGIKTKDLIILDEPTDGFSSEQLDKVREVLEEMRVKQTIIVSHENKIESFVDNVIKINKKEHVSEVN